MDDESPWLSERQMLALTDAELANVDPVVMNLVIAKGVPALAELEIARYVELADRWTADPRRRMSTFEEQENTRGLEERSFLIPTGDRLLVR
jgi:hypothetical protein